MLCERVVRYDHVCVDMCVSNTNIQTLLHVRINHLLFFSFDYGRVNLSNVYSKLASATSTVPDYMSLI